MVMLGATAQISLAECNILELDSGGPKLSETNSVPFNLSATKK